MTDTAPPYLDHRSVSRNRFLSRCYRYRVLLAAKWWIPTSAVALGLSIAATVASLRLPTFLSFGRMIVSIKLALPEGSVYAEEMGSFLGTQSALMQSGEVINRAWAQLVADWADAPAKPFELKVSVLPKTSIFVLQATGSNPKYTRAFLQLCMRQYIQIKKEMREQASDTTLAGLTHEVLRLEKQLAHSDEELAGFQSTNSVEVFQEQGSSAARYLGGLNQRLAGLQSELELLQAITPEQHFACAQGTAQLPFPREREATETAQPAAEFDYLKARQQLLVLKAEQEELGHFLRPQHPRMIALNEDIARRQRWLGIFQQQSAELLQSRKESLQLQVANLRKDAEAWEAKALEISRLNAEHQRLKGNVQRAQSLYERLLSIMQTLDLNRQINPEGVTIMEDASVAVPARLELWRHLLAGSVAGLGIGLGLLVLLDRFDDRMNCLLELQENFPEEVLGQIPRQNGRQNEQRAGLIQPEDKRPAFVEAYRNLRSSLLYLAESGRRPKTLLVTSAVPNEGKSLTAANLASIMATAGARVLLVDADLRKGTLNDYFGQPSGPGLDEVLCGSVQWRGTIQSTRLPNLQLLARGRTTQNSSELLMSKHMESFLREAAAEYDHVLLDTAPVMATDDASSLAPRVDGVVFLIRAEQTSARVARVGLEMLYQRGANVLGVVFNAVHPRSSGYAYYHYQDYYRTTL